MTLGIVVGLMGVAQAAALPAAETRVESRITGSAGDLSPAGARAFADVAQCAAGGGTLLAAIVVDESGSLRETDPEDQRVEAIRTAVDSLAALGAVEDSLVVEASLATFSSDYQSLVGWGAVSGQHYDELMSAAGSLATRDAGEYTDYRSALVGARASLDQRSAEIGGPTCRILLWFTDGKLDVGDQTDEALAELCSPSGIVDGLRGDGIAILSLALFTEGGAGTVSDADREQLRAVAEGTGAGVTCGTVPLPAGSVGGAYLRADQPEALSRLFASASALIEGGAPGLSVVCPDEATCVDGVLEIPVDAGVGGFRAVVEVGDGARGPQLVSPDGASVPPGGGPSADGADVVVSQQGALQLYDVIYPPGGSVGGTWRLVSDPSTTTVIDLYYFWRTRLALEGAAPTDAAPAGTLVIGEETTVTVSLQHSDGTPVDTSSFASFDLTVLVAGEPAQPTTVAPGSFAVSVALPADGAPSEVQIDAVASATSSPSRTSLGPVAVSSVLPTVLPPSYPTIEPSRVVLGQLVGDEAAHGELRVTGSDRGDTNACVGPASVAGPEAAGTLRLSSEVECVDVPAGQTVTIELVASAQHPADGSLTGTIPVTLTGVDAAEPVTMDVPVEATMVRPVDEGKRWGLAAVFLVLALVLAWAVAELSRRRSDRFHVGPFSRTTAVPVVLSRDGLARRGGGALLDPEKDFRGLQVPEDRNVARRSLGAVELGRRFPVFPLASGRGWAQATDGSIVVSTNRRASVQDAAGRRAPVDFPGNTDGVLVVHGGTGDETATGGSWDATLVLLDDARNGDVALADRWRTRLSDVNWESVVDAVEAAVAAREAAARTATERSARTRSTSAEGSVETAFEEQASPERRPRSIFDDPAGPAETGGPRPPSLFEDDGRGTAPPPSRTADPDHRRPPSIFDD
ncbi:VWA domain-containing protein [Cellulosimicrobium sp. I38E]|uniref:VWA domain-containing protein n=1 Tax=Cellulosimicrobium sp. I38E TaxID=1393139 RepID=UPI0015606F76|nr:VWA domain-containing protein [Cellulosimicrobium sp. I38E]